MEHFLAIATIVAILTVLVMIMRSIDDVPTDSIKQVKKRRTQPTKKRSPRVRKGDAT